MSQYRRVQLAAYTYEITFGNLSRETLAQFETDIAQLQAEIGGHAPHILFLFDVSANLAPTPYAIQFFTNLRQKGNLIDAPLVKVAVLAKRSMFFGIVENLINRTLGNEDGTLRLFTEREQALRWLKNGLPAL
ncbi:MAG: hypothetical protein OHK0023_12840 [Anaerolineae bacterium]